MKKLLQEFKEFIARGNVLDMAIGVVIGTAFTAIVNSVVNDVIMPLVGHALGGMDFSSYKFVLSPAVGEVPEVAIGYGLLIQKVIHFLLIALVVFLVIKAFTSLRKKKEEAPKAPPDPPKPEPAVELLTQIRDLLERSKQ